MAGLTGRIGAALATLVGVTLVTFLVLAAMPGDPLAALVAADQLVALDEEARAALEERLGLDRSLLVRYLAWLGGILRGDFGESFASGRPVVEEIGARLPATLELNALALLVAFTGGVSLGLLGAARAHGPFDRALGALLLALYALPFFWLALMAQKVFAVEWDLLPLYGRTPAGDGAGLAGRLGHLVLPAGTLALHALAFYARFARNAALEGLGASHARAARALGVGEARVFFQHGVRLALVPTAALLGVMVPTLVSGSILVETIFRWPGLGWLFVRAILVRDIPLVLGLTLVAALLTVAGSLLADLLARLADPRRREAGTP